ncbi:MAG: RNA polymerase sigma factor [Acidobacteriota bacterium]
MSDEDLLQLMIGGDEDAFVLLFRKRQGAIYRFALQMTGSEATADDVTQEVFMALLRSASRFDPSRGPLLSFLYGIARNQVLRRLERDRPFLPLDRPETDGDEVAELVDRRDPLMDLTRNELIEGVRQTVLTLPQHYREAVVLCDLHEMSYAETAEVLGCAVGTVRSRLHRARAMLLERLRPRVEADTDSINAGVMRSLV